MWRHNFLSAEVYLKIAEREVFLFSQSRGASFEVLHQLAQISNLEMHSCTLRHSLSWWGCDWWVAGWCYLQCLALLNAEYEPDIISSRGSSSRSNHGPSSHSTLLWWTGLRLSVSLYYSLLPLSSFVRQLFFVSLLSVSLLLWTPLTLSTPRMWLWVDQKMRGTEQAIHHPAKPPFQRMRKLTHSLKCTHTLAPPLSSFFRYVQAFMCFSFFTSISATFFHFIPTFFFALQDDSSSFSFCSHSHLTLLLLIHIHLSLRESRTSHSLVAILPRSQTVPQNVSNVQKNLSVQHKLWHVPEP